MITRRYRSIGQGTTEGRGRAYSRGHVGTQRTQRDEAVEAAKRFQTDGCRRRGKAFPASALHRVANTQMILGESVLDDSGKGSGMIVQQRDCNTSAGRLNVSEKPRLLRRRTERGECE